MGIARFVYTSLCSVRSTTDNYQVRATHRLSLRPLRVVNEVLEKNDGDNRSYRVCFDKINARLPGFKCERNAGLGARELLDVFQKIAMAPETFEFRAFTRLKELQHLLGTGQIDDRFFWKTAEKAGVSEHGSSANGRNLEPSAL